MKWEIYPGKQNLRLSWLLENTSQVLYIEISKSKISSKGMPWKQTGLQQRHLFQ
jgi:hypothetical protein